MSIRSWWEARRRRADAKTIRYAEEDAVDTPDERHITQSDRWGLAADEHESRRAGEASIKDVERLGD